MSIFLYFGIGNFFLHFTFLQWTITSRFYPCILVTIITILHHNIVWFLHIINLTVCSIIDFLKTDRSLGTVLPIKLSKNSSYLFLYLVRHLICRDLWLIECWSLRIFWTGFSIYYNKSIIHSYFVKYNRIINQKKSFMVSFSVILVPVPYWNLYWTPA